MADPSNLKGKQVFCDVCGVTLPSASLLPTHNKGKKHQRLLNLKQERENSSRRSIYVRGFQNSGSIEEELANYFNVYGKVSNIFLDKDKGVFAIVQLANEESVTTVLNQQSLPLLNGKRLTVKERTDTKTGLQFKTQKSRKRKHDDSQQHHQGHWENKEMAPFLSKDLIVKLNSYLTVEELVNFLMQQLCLTDEDIKLRRLVCQLLQEVLSEVYTGASVVPFGSTVSGVGWKGSDLDVCLLTSQLDDTGVDYSLVVDVLRRFAPGCTNIIPVLTAKCPLIKFTHQPSGLSCDLSVNNRLGVRNSELLHCYMSLDPRIPQLVFIVRAWAKAKAISLSKQLSNYALTLMVLYFLQVQDPPVIPSLQQELKTWIKDTSDSCTTKDHGYALEPNSGIIDNWNCSFFTDVARLSPSQNTKSLSQLLEEFFCFFSTEFDFANCVVSIRKGQRTSIASVLEELKSAQCLETSDNYVSLITDDGDQACEKPLTKNDCASTHFKGASEMSGETTEQQKAIPDSTMACSSGSPGTGKLLEFKMSPLCVQDPFELVHNLTQNITMATLKHIIELMKIAHKICKDLNTSGDDPKNKESNLLNLLTVCKSSKKRKSSHCHTFFVEYQDNNSSQATGTHCGNNLTSPQAIFLFVFETLEREFGFHCEMKSPTKRLRFSEADSDVPEETQAVKMSQVVHLSKDSPTGSCTNTRNDSEPKKQENETRASEEIIINKFEDDFSAICTAFQNTWTHCRRERRKLLQLQRHSNDNTDSSDRDKSSDTKSEHTSVEFGESSTVISSPPKQFEEFADAHTVPSPILSFELNVDSSHQKDFKHGCTVSMELSESKDLQLFGNFFSAYKKYFMGLVMK